MRTLFLQEESAFGFRVAPPVSLTWRRVEGLQRLVWLSNGARP